MASQEFRHNYRVEPSTSYDAFPISPPAEGKVEQLVTDIRKFAGVSKELPRLGKKRAIWISHGMGQQIRFATLDQVAEGLIAAAERANSPVGSPEVQYRNVKVDKTILQRVELKFPRANAEPVEVHLYECYWAPKTEGVVGLKDVISFLWSCGIRGLLNSFKPFGRALFGQMESFTITWRTPTYLLFTLAILAALMVINTVIIAAGASSAHIANAEALITPAIRPALTALASMVCLTALTFGIMLYLASLSRPRGVQWFCWGALILAALVMVLSAAHMAIIVWLHYVPCWLTSPFQENIHGLTNMLVFTSLALVPLALLKRWIHGSDNDSEESMQPRFLFYLAVLIFVAGIAGMIWLIAHGGAFAWSAAPWTGWKLTLRNLVFSYLWIWPFLAVISRYIRELLVQYVGDVAAYISSNKIDRFEEVRQKIKDCALETATAVYRVKTDELHQLEYEKIAIVGHSLGSVIAYDTLNRLLNDDELSNCWLQITQRTCLLMTFGSPLDKIAFFFTIMGETTRHVREQLAAVVQPLIQRSPVRERIPWVNVYSRSDVICGSLDFYDQPPDSANPPVQGVRRVENVKDPDALIPLSAHVEYWNNRTVWDRVLAEITA